MITNQQALGIEAALEELKKFYPSEDINPIIKSFQEMRTEFSTYKRAYAAACRLFDAIPVHVQVEWKDVQLMSNFTDIRKALDVRQGASLLQVLKSIEWSGTAYDSEGRARRCCPYCSCTPSSHEPTCKLNAFIEEYSVYVKTR